MMNLTRISAPDRKLFLTLCASAALLVACTDDGPADSSSSNGTAGTAETSSSGDGDGDASETGTASASGDGDGDMTGDGDGDPATGDGDGDMTGDGDGDMTGDGDGDMTGDGDGDMTGDGDGDGDPGDGDGDPGDGDGDPGDGDGDDPPPIEDEDMDGIPDPDDPFPNDPDLPGQATANLVYAHTSSRLFTMDPFDYEIVEIGPFSFNQSNGSVTDIAIDRWGVLYAITFNDIFVCNPETAECIYLGDLPQSFNGMTMVPPGTIDDNDDTLIGIANSGTWYTIEIVNQQAQLQQIGQYGMNMTSSGDAFSIAGTGTFGAVNKPGENAGDVIVESDPTTGMVIDELIVTAGYTNLWGVAGWEGTIFGFNSGGEVIQVDPNNPNQVVEVANTNNAWWGAGVYSVLPQ